MDVSELRGLLRPWGCDPSWSLTPVVQQGGASRTWTVGVGGVSTYVAKLIFDGRPYAEPGLRVAAELAGRGVATGPPVPTRAGALGVDVAGEGDRRWTLALLRFEPGDPLGRGAAHAAVLAGDLLGRVHAALAPLPASLVPGRLVDWCVHRAADVSAECRQSAELVRELAAAGRLRCHIVYGDPGPEVLVDGRRAALIDWGTPSWGPALHDVAVWTRYFYATAAEPARQAEFLEAYSQHAGVTPPEFQHLPVVLDLLCRLGLFGSNDGQPSSI